MRKYHNTSQETSFLYVFTKKVSKKFGSLVKTYYLCIAIQKSLNWCTSKEVLERWQSGRLHRSWKPTYWEVPGVRIPLSPLLQCRNLLIISLLRHFSFLLKPRIKPISIWKTRRQAKDSLLMFHNIYEEFLL